MDLHRAADEDATAWAGASCRSSHRQHRIERAGGVEEHRNDALGHRGKGEGSTRYAKATRVAKIKALVDQIPIVTDHLPDYQETHLLPVSKRQPRARRVRNSKSAAD